MAPGGQGARALEALDLPPLASACANAIVDMFGDAGAASDLPQYFRAMKAQGGAEFRASTAQRMATLADAGRQGEHAAAAAWLVRRCELLWSRGYFSKSRESDKTEDPWGVVVLSTLGADYLYGRLSEGAAPAEALQELLCALLALRHVAGVARHGPVAKLRTTAAHAAAYTAIAWLKLYGVNDPPPAVWQEGGLLEVWALQLTNLMQQWQPTTDCYAMAHVYLVQATTFLKAFLGGQHKGAQQAAWRWLLPVCMEAGVVAGMYPAFEEPSVDLRVVWHDLVAALRPLALVLAEAQLSQGKDQAELSELLTFVDEPEPFQALAVLLRQVASACASLSPHSAQHVRQFEEILLEPPAWWKPVNDALTDLLLLAVELVGKRELQVEAFLDDAMAAIHQYLEFWGPEVDKLYPDHPRMHYHAGQLLDLAASCMASYNGGKVAQAMFGHKGLTLCIAALENMVEPDLLVIDAGPDRWGACKSLLRALECACHSSHNIYVSNCLLFVEEGGVEAVISAVLPQHPPPSESAARQNTHCRTTSLMRNGISLLASVVDALNDSQEDSDRVRRQACLSNIVAILEDAFGQQDCTLAFGLMRLVQWGIVANLGEGPNPDKISAQSPSRHSLLSGALTLLNACAEHDPAALEAVASSPASLATLQRAGQQYLGRGVAAHVMGASRPWLQTLAVLVRHAPACEDELLSKGLLKTAGTLVGLAASCLVMTGEATNVERLEELSSSLESTDAALAFQHVQGAMLTAQGQAVESCAALFHALNQQATPTSARCCETLLAATWPTAELDPAGLPEPLQLLVQRMWEARDTVARQRRLESATLERKAKEAEAAFAALMAEEEEAQQKQAASQAKKAAKRQKQKERAAAEREAAAAAAAAAAEAEAARQAEQQRQREAQQQAGGQQAAGAEAGGSKKKKKKKKGGQAAEPAGPGAEQQEQAAGSSQQPPAQQQQQQQQQQVGGALGEAATPPQVPPLHPAERTPEAQGLGAVAAAASSHADEAEELQDLLAHLLPGVYPSSAGSSAVATPDAPLVGAAPPPPPLPPQWLEQPQQQGPQQQGQREPQQAAPPPPPPQQQQQQQQQQQREWERFPAQLRAVLSCPLTGGMLTDPVILSDGHSYERHAAEAWLASNDCSPLTGEALDTSVCRPNHALRQLIEEIA